jgi:LPXTG-site transpeptidase (sortase) family protein
LRQLLLGLGIAVVAIACWVGGVAVGQPGGAQPSGPALPGTTAPPRTIAPLSSTPPLKRLPGEQSAAGSTPPAGHASSRPSTAQAGVTIAIARLGIRASVFDRGENADGSLAIAPGYSLTHLRFSAPLGTWGNYVLYGHDDIDHQILRDLPALRLGDRIVLDRAGTLFVYQVFDRRIVPPTDVGLLDQTAEPILTLISCYPYGVDSERIVLLASLIEVDDRAGAGA